MQEQRVRKRKKKKTAIRFDAGKVFDVKPSENLKLHVDAARYKAKKGQAGGSPPVETDYGESRYCRHCGAVSPGSCICKSSRGG